MRNEIDYHLERARTEGEIAYRSTQFCASVAHVHLACLHLQRAQLLQKVQVAPVGNVTPIRLASVSSTAPPICGEGAQLDHAHDRISTIAPLTRT
jgi:hypothetical protein